jgi:mitochondrial distribution and morphology protein 12
MSIDINWEALTTGPDGDALAEQIRDFIHDRFQTITFPRFIQSVAVHTFEFGAVGPEITIKDICDPLPDFYNEGSEEGDGSDAESSEEEPDSQARTLRERRRAARENTATASNTTLEHPLPTPLPSSHLRSALSPTEQFNPLFRTPTPLAPGGTTNLHYFTSALASGLSGTQTPLAAVAGAHAPWDAAQNHNWQQGGIGGRYGKGHERTVSNSSISRPSTASDLSFHPLEGNSSPIQQSIEVENETEIAVEIPSRPKSPRPNDTQIVSRVRYSGDIKISLTATILLDYPMPSFVGIPVHLNITGLTFDGVAVVASIRKKAHFCFLSEEDAAVLVDHTDSEDEGQGPTDGSSRTQRSKEGAKFGGLLQEIKVESEIGQKEQGKQVLKNVGKVEKFVLEQVRRIFEDELVYPSFWTFLV